VKRSSRLSQFLVFLLIFNISCEREKIPTVTTALVTDIETTQAKGGGEVTHDGNTDIIVRGACWSTKKKPDIKDPRTTDGFGVGSYISLITNLTPNTFYYIRAYATNTVGTGYGNQLSFTTPQITTATLTTTSISTITQTSAVSGGNITSDGGSPVTARGVCWSKTTNPTINNNKTTDGTGTGIFTSNITGLTGNTKYYLKAYATNSEGISYGDELWFLTSSVLPSITTSVVTPTSTTTATGGGDITADGGAFVTARGVCWSLAANPTISNSKTTDGSGTGIFESKIAGLLPNTEYHVRAYATNSAGTAYGQDRTFKTDPLTVKDYDGNDYHVIRIGTQLWTKENLKTTKYINGTSIPLVTSDAAWSALTTHGYCWYDNDMASYKDTYGALYNWYSVKTANLCPTGWHVPTDNDWIVLENFLGGASPAGGKLKEEGTTHWLTPNTGATNDTDFTALPGGYRLDDGQFDNLGKYGYWWSSSEYVSPDAWSRRMQYDSDKVFRYYISEKYGRSVRCIRD
jgi:uncharacterized protein (TIGR02145 family)